MSISRSKEDQNAEKEWNLDDYPDVADYSEMKKKDLIDLLGNDIFGLYGILAICDIIFLEDDDPEKPEDIKTACVTLNANPKIFINRKFINKFCPSPNHVLMILLHELYHKILNHASLFRTSKDEDKPLLNVATDAFINALLYQLYPEDRHSSFFRDFYNKLIEEKKQEKPGYDGYPFHLLKNKSTHQISNFRIREFYNNLYSPFGKDVESIIALLRETAPPGTCKYVQGIGDHSGMNGQMGEAMRKEIMKVAKKMQKTLQDQAEEYNKMLEARKKAEEEAKKREEKGKGKKKGEKGEERGVGDSDFDPDEREKQQDFDPNGTAFCRYVGGIIEYLEKKDKDLSESMIRMAKQSVESKVIIKTKNMFPAIPGMTVRPNYKDKGAIVAYSMGRYKPFYKNNLMPKDFGLCHVYIDVSGSMGSYVDNIYTVLSSRSLHDLLWPKIHLFSTHIEDITKKELREKVIDTSCGTDFNLIFDHMEAEKIQKALIFTDGYGDISEDRIRVIKKNKIRVITVFTPDRSDKNPFVPVSEACFTFAENMQVQEDTIKDGRLVED